MLNKRFLILPILIACNSSSFKESNIILPEPEQSNNLDSSSFVTFTNITVNNALNNSVISNSSCPEDMIEVEGDYCPEIEQICINMDKSIHNVNGYVKCDEYQSPSKCLSKTKKHLHFCMDTFEFPNKKGEKPTVMISWNQMNDASKLIGKRLCRDIEWTLACEGSEILPYPYGYKRDATACNIDHLQIPGFDASKDKMTPDLVAKLDQRVASGSMERCVSPFGVHDMTGNVDEHVVNSSGKPYKSSLKSGSWLLGHRARCRPATLIHNENFVFYSIGTRFCKDINDKS